MYMLIYIYLSVFFTLQWVLISWFLLTIMVLYVSVFLESLNNFIISESFILLIFWNYGYSFIYWPSPDYLWKLVRSAEHIFLFSFPLLEIWAISAFPLLSFQLHKGCSLLKDLLQTFLLSWNLGLSFLFVCFVFSVGDGSGVIYHQAVFSLTLLNWTVYVWFSGLSFNNFIFIMKMAHFMSVFLPVWKSSWLHRSRLCHAEPPGDCEVINFILRVGPLSL